MRRDEILQPGTYAAIPKSTLANPNLTAGDKLVIMALLDHLGRNDRAWPGPATLAAETGLCHKTVKTSLKRLKDTAIIEAVETPGGRTRRRAWQFTNAIFGGGTAALHGVKIAPPPVALHGGENTQGKKFPTDGEKIAPPEGQKSTGGGEKNTIHLNYRIELPNGTPEGTTEGAALGGVGAPAGPCGPGSTSAALPVVGAVEAPVSVQTPSAPIAAVETQASTLVAIPTATTGAVEVPSEWVELDCFIFDAEWESDEEWETAGAPNLPVTAPPVDPATIPAATQTAPSVSEPIKSSTDAPAPPPLPVIAANAPKERPTRKTRRGGKSDTDEPSADEIPLICNSRETMELWLTFGMDKVLDPTKETPPSRMNWRVNIKDPSEFTAESYNADQWTIPQLVGFFWLRVSAWRDERGIAQGFRGRSYVDWRRERSDAGRSSGNLGRPGYVSDDSWFLRDSEHSCSAFTRIA